MLPVISGLAGVRAVLSIDTRKAERGGARRQAGAQDPQRRVGADP